jgi:cell filamentation protein
MSRYDADDHYCIPGTSVLRNKAGITDQQLLDEFEADYTTVRIIELAQTPLKLKASF